MLRALTIDQERELITRYQNQERAATLAVVFKVPVQTVYNILRRSGVSARLQSVSKDQCALILKACKKGVPVATIAKQLGISKSSATRLLRRYRKEGNTIEIRKGRPQKIVIVVNTTADKEEPDLALIERAYQALRRVPFPFSMQCPSVEHEIAKLRRIPMHIENEEIRPRVTHGIRLCAPFFPNRYKATWRATQSAFDAWHDEAMMRKAIRFQLMHGDPVTPQRVLRAITMMCRTPGIFRPSVAKFIYTNYCPLGGIVWDPCAGFGGRLLGAHAAGVRYIGTDVDLATVEGNQRLAECIKSNAEIIAMPAENFDAPPVDLVFTSPPYFDQERYSFAEQQSWKRYRNLDAWIDGFICPVVHRSHLALRDGGCLILNVADVKARGKTIPIVARVFSAALDSGFVHVATLQMPLSAINRTHPIEPILVFRKGGRTQSSTAPLISI